MRTLSASALVALLTAGCLPTRDNPLDNANAPNPVLAVVDRNVDGGCQTQDPLENWPAVPIAHRTSCLALDARNTTDPQGTSLDDLRFTFERVVIAGGEFAPIEEYASKQLGEPLFVLDSAVSSGFPVDTIYFRVTVHDPDGAVGTAVGSVGLVDRAPVVAPQPPRILTLEAPGSTHAITIPARATDPDGDVMVQWRWTDEEGTVVSTSSNATLEIATGQEGRRLFFVDAFDGYEWSKRVATQVRVQSAIPWVIGPRDPSNAIVESFARVGERRVISKVFDGSENSFDVTFTNGIAAHSAGGATRLAVTASPYLLLLLDWPSLQVLDSVDLPFAYDAIGLHFDDQGTVWVATMTYNQGTDRRQISGYDTSNDAFTLVTPVVSTIPASFTNDFGPQYVNIQRDSDGILWVAGRREPFARAFLPSATGFEMIGESPADVDTSFKVLARRPGSPGVWAVQTHHLVGTESSQAFLVHLRIENGSIQRTDIPLATAEADGLAWQDESYFWISLAERGLCLVDARILEAGGELDDAIELTHPTAASFSGVVLDPVTGTSWWSSEFNTFVASAPLQGSISVEPSDARVHAMDPDGNLLFVSNPDFNGFGELSIGESASRGSIVADFQTSAIGAVPDGEGGLWIASISPKILRRLAADGSIIDVISALDIDGEVQSIPATISVGYDGAGRLLLHGVRDPNLGAVSMLRLDVQGRLPGDETPVPTEILFEELVFMHDHIYMAASTETFFYFDIFGGEVIRRNMDGTNPEAVFDPSGSTSWAAAISRSGTLCVADRSGATVTVATVPPIGPATTTTALSFGVGPDVIDAGYTVDYVSDPDIEVCWIGVRERNPSSPTSPRLALYGYDSAGTLIRYWADPTYEEGDVRAVFPLTNDSVRIIRDAGGERRLEAIEWDTTGLPTRHSLGATAYFEFLER